MKFKVTYKVLDTDQIAGRKPYGNEEKIIEIAEADDAETAIECVQDNLTDTSTNNGLRLFDGDIDTPIEVSADLIFVDRMTDKIVNGYYDFVAVPEREEC